MNSCILFAVTLFNYDQQNVLREFLYAFKDSFPYCDIYIGINYGSISETESIIKEYNLNVTIDRIYDKDLYTGSDAGAYQLALKLLKQSNKKYDLYWFAHTKGAVNHRPLERLMYLSKIFGNRDNIEKLFTEHQMIGSYALRGVSISAGGDNWKTFNFDHDIKICSNEQFGPFQCTHVNWSYIETMYVLNKSSVESFLAYTTDKFYDTKIPHACYFEVIFPWIASRCGYFPYIVESKCFFNKGNLKNITQEWIIENKLTHLNGYLEL